MIICCSLSQVSAEDLNETQVILKDNAIFEENTTLGIEESSDIISSNEANSSASNKQKYGIVDFGSNNIKLNIYQYNPNKDKIKSVLSQSEASVIKGYIENNTLTERGINKLIGIYEDFEDIMDLVNVDVKYYYATASLRNVNNYMEVIDAVKNRMGIDLHIISGEEEANASFNAIKEELKVDNGLFLDLGGGSCELITFENKTPTTKRSLPVGSFSAYRNFVSTMFPTDDEIKEIENWTLSHLTNSSIHYTSQDYLYGSGGSISAIKKVLKYLNYISEDAREYSVDDLNSLLLELKNNTKEDYEKVLFSAADDINTVVPGAIIIKTIADYFNVTKIYDCKNKLSYGILLNILNNNKITISTNNVEKYYKGPEKLIVNISDSKSNPIKNQLVQLTINGVTYNRTSDEKGSVSIAINLNSGKYKIQIRVNNTKITSKVTVLPTVNATDLVKIFRNDTQFWATFKDKQGNYLAEGTTVQFNINGVLYNRQITGNKGLAKLNINLEQGKYIITSINLVTGESSANNITVLPKIIENNDLVKDYKKDSQFTVKVLAGDGTVAKNADVTFNINGVLYIRQSDESGIAKLNINLMAGKYIITSEYEGCMVSNTITVV